MGGISGKEDDDKEIRGTSKKKLCIELTRTMTTKHHVLPPSQNVRRLIFSQKSTYFKFDQIYT
jgi:hypothetical protein